MVEHIKAVEYYAVPRKFQQSQGEFLSLNQLSRESHIYIF